MERGIFLLPVKIQKTKTNHDKGKKQLETDDKLYIWVHEQKRRGSAKRGSGLSAHGFVASVEFEAVKCRVQLRDLVMQKPPLGFESLNGMAAKSEALNFLDSSRHTKVVALSDAEANEFEILIDASTRFKQQQISEADARQALTSDWHNIPDADQIARFALQEIRPGQNKFKQRLLSLYAGKCVMTGTVVPAVVEAAHIIPFSENLAFKYDPSNGLLLRSDIHRLFDSHLLGINPISREIHLSQSVKDTEYGQFLGKLVNCPYASSELLKARFKVFQSQQ